MNIMNTTMKCIFEVIKSLSLVLVDSCLTGSAYALMFDHNVHFSHVIVQI